MRFLGVTETCDLLDLYLQLKAEGHDVRVAVSEPLARGTGSGLIPTVEDWRYELDWVGRDGIIIFEAVSDGLGAMQDDLRRRGYHVIGGSEFGDRLENDRAFALDLLVSLGFRADTFHEFDNTASAISFIAAHPRRYVLKFSGPSFASHDNFIGQLPDGRDVAMMLQIMPAEEATRFILMDFIEGVEVGIGAYFDGKHFIEPACLDWEHKRFFPGDLGELTGEMGTVATFENTQQFFAKTLKRLELTLQGRGHVGYINLNTIANADGVWPIEFTCRFGYPGFAVLAPLQRTGWGTLFARMVGLSDKPFETEKGWSLGIVVTTPPFPWSRHDIESPIGLPVVLEQMHEDDMKHVHVGEVGLRDGVLVTSGLYGWTAVVTGVGHTIEAARDAAYRLVCKIIVPNARYRLDIGEKLVAKDFELSKLLNILSS